ncbi:unnamed protein product [Cochlearia groenlandica]
MDLVEYIDVHVFAEGQAESDDENPQERQERYDYDLEKSVRDFVNESFLRHNVIPESDSEGEEEGYVPRKMNRGNGVLYERQVLEWDSFQRSCS